MITLMISVCLPVSFFHGFTFQFNRLCTTTGNTLSSHKYSISATQLGNMQPQDMKSRHVQVHCLTRDSTVSCGHLDLPAKKTPVRNRLHRVVLSMALLRVQHDTQLGSVHFNGVRELANTSYSHISA